MKTFTALQLVSWTMAQPAEKEVAMQTGMFYHDCGCLMTQFFRAQGIEKGYMTYLDGSLVESWPNPGKVVAQIELPINNIFRFLYDESQDESRALATFGDIQKCLRQNQKELVDKAAE